MFKIKSLSFFISFFGLLTLGCASHPNLIYPAFLDLKQNQCEAALLKLQPLAEKNNDDQLLNLMEYGSALQICKEYSKSNAILQQSNKLSEDLDYVSVSRSVGATLLNEQMLQYKGDKFEKLFINALTALNYLELGDLENALVEAKQINEKTKRFAEEEKRSFELNSFSNYLSGLIYEFDKKYDDACISYQEAYKLDSSFRPVALDMLTACWRAKRKDEFNQLVKKIQASNEEIEYAKRIYKKTKETVFIFLQGWGPYKAVRNDNSIYPYLRPSFSLTKKLIISSEAENQNDIKISEPIYNVEKAAIQTLEADYNSLGARRFGARVAKEVVADQIRQKDKALGNIAWLVMVASEHADLRNWTLLPETVQIVRMNTEKIKSVKLSGHGADSGETEDLGRIDLEAHPKKSFYLIRSVK